MHSELTEKQVRWRMRIFTLSWLAYAGFYLVRKNLSVIKPELTEADVGLTDNEFALITGGYSLFYAMGQFFNGVLSDRYGARLIVSLGLFLSVLMNLTMGFMYALPYVFLTLVCLNGLGQSTGWSGLVKMMACWFRPQERGVVMAWWGTNYVLGGFFATLFATFCMYRLPFFANLGWQRGFWIPALMLAGIAMLYALYSRDDCTSAGVPEIVHEHVVDGDKEAVIGEEDHPGSWSIILDVIRQPAVWLIALMYFFLKLTRYSFLFWLPDYMHTHLLYTKEMSGYTSSVYELVGFAGAVSAGYFSDKLFQSRRMPVGALMLWALAIMFFLHPTIAQWGFWGNAIGIALIGYFTYGPDTLMTGAGAQDAATKRGAATAAGFINGIGSCGQFFAGFVTAYVKNTYGWDALFYLFGVMVLIGGLILAPKWNYRAVSD